MFKKILRQSIAYQAVLIIVLLALVFSVVGVYEYQRMKVDIKENLTKAESIRFYEYFNSLGDTDKNTAIRYEKKIAAFYISNNSVNVIVSNPDFCPEKIKEEIVNASFKQSEGQIKSDGYYMAYRRKQAQKGDIIYIYDFTEEYDSYQNNIFLILIMALMVTTIVVFFTIYFTKRNLTPMKAAFDKQKELIANASHELKTPLTILSTQTEIVNSFDELSDEHKKWVNGIQEQVERMRHLVGEMLELARFEAVRNEESYRIFNLSELVNKVVLGTEVLAFENNVDCITDIVPRAMVYADPDGIEKVVYTLMENALKYTPAGERIYIKVRIDSHRVILVIRNTGVALPKSDIPFLFDRFYRGDKAHTSTNNFGLGLAIAQAIVEGNKGRIGCSSVDDGNTKYTEFIVNLRHYAEKQIAKKEKKNAKKKSSSRKK